MNFRALSTLSCMFLLAGCMVGPKYTRPAAPVPPGYKEQPPQSLQESDQWKLGHPNADVLRTKWWEIFGDPQLNTLEEQVAVSNQNLKMAEARFRQARAIVRYNRAGEFPTISVGPGIEALRYSPNQPYFPSSGVGVSSASAFLLPSMSPTRLTFGAAYVAPWHLRARRLRLPLPICKRWLLVCTQNSYTTTSNCAAPTRKRDYWTTP